MATGTFGAVSIPAANVNAGSLGSSVIASSIAVGAVQDASIVSVSASKLTGSVADSALDNSSVTLQGNTFNAANKLVKLDGSNRLPAVDGSLLTNLTATVSSVTAPLTGNGTGGSPLGVNPSSVTLQGNSFNGASQLVQLNGSGALPALSGANLTSLTPGNIASGSLPATVIASSHAVASVGAPQLAALTGAVTFGAGGSIGASSGAGLSVSTNILVANGANVSTITPTGIQTGSLSLTTALGVANGGTGLGSISTNGIPYGNGTGALNVLAQGTGVIQETAGAPAFTTSPTLVGTNFSGVHNTASVTLTGTITSAAATFSGCVTGSTVTVTTGANPVEVVFSGAVSNAKNSGAVVTFLIDGGFPTGLSATQGVTAGLTAIMNGDFNLSFSYPTASLTAGSHSFCLGLMTSAGGTATLDTTAAAPRFSVMELK
jgi:hypothetical protein